MKNRVKKKKSKRLVTSITCSTNSVTVDLVKQVPLASQLNNILGVWGHFLSERGRLGSVVQWKSYPNPGETQIKAPYTYGLGVGET